MSSLLKVSFPSVSFHCSMFFCLYNHFLSKDIQIDLFMQVEVNLMILEILNFDLPSIFKGLTMQWLCFTKK